MTAPKVLLALIFAAAAPAQEVAPLGFLTGCWQGPGGSTEEQWMKPAGGTLFGMSRTVARGRTVFYEFLHIRVEDGAVVLVVQHSNHPRPVAFRATKVSDTEVIFENPEHDFPQRILYRKQSDGSLFARIDGKEKGQPKAVDFPMTRAKCD